jgi:hypothetical protein
MCHAVDRGGEANHRPQDENENDDGRHGRQTKADETIFARGQVAFSVTQRHNARMPASEVGSLQQPMIFVPPPHNDRRARNETPRLK